MKENTNKKLDALTPEMLDETVGTVEIKKVPEGVSSEKIKRNVLAATGLTEENKSKPGKVKFSLRRKWVPAVAACLVMAVAAAAVLPAVLKTGNTDNPDPRSTSDSRIQGIKIDSLDKVNFYAADKMLKNKVKSMRFPGTASLYGPEDELYIDGKIVDPDAGNEIGGNEPVVIPEEDTVWSFPLDPDTEYVITRVIRFKINLTDGENPIANHLGTGIVTVTITENTLMDMLTFEKEGEFYSVCDYENLEMGKRFFSIKYIRGFNVCKDEVETYYVFDLNNDENGDIRSFAVKKTGVSGTENEVTVPEIIEDSIEIAEGYETFTLRGLEELYSGTADI